MDELTILKPILQRNRNKDSRPRGDSTPRGIHYWVFFKRHILEEREVREQFEQAVLDQAQFRELVRETTAKKPLPYFCRPRGKIKPDTAQRNMREMLTILYRYYEALLHPKSLIHVVESKCVGGLGVCARDPAIIKEGNAVFADHLWGVPFEVSDDNFEELHAKGYPSLYTTNDGRGHILAGPLSLVNHRCGSPLVLSMPRKTTRPISEEFEGMPVVIVRATRHYHVHKDEELEINYFVGGAVSFPGGKCKCRVCSP